MGTAPLANGFYSEDNYYEFVAKDVSKGSMLADIRAQLPILSARRKDLYELSEK